MLFISSHPVFLYPLSIRSLIRHDPEGFYLHLLLSSFLPFPTGEKNAIQKHRSISARQSNHSRDTRKDTRKHGCPVSSLDYSRADNFHDFLKIVIAMLYKQYEIQKLTALPASHLSQKSWPCHIPYCYLLRGSKKHMALVVFGSCNCPIRPKSGKAAKLKGLSPLHPALGICCLPASVATSTTSVYPPLLPSSSSSSSSSLPTYLPSFPSLTRFNGPTLPD